MGNDFGKRGHVKRLQKTSRFDGRLHEKRSNEIAGIALEAIPVRKATQHIGSLLFLSITLNSFAHRAHDMYPYPCSQDARRMRMPTSPRLNCLSPPGVLALRPRERLTRGASFARRSAVKT